MNTVSYNPESVTIPFNDTPIMIGDVVYRNIVVVARLLNTEEILRLYSLRMNNEFEEEAINEDIFKLCLIDIIGVHGDIDINKTSAGFITTVAKAIYLKSISHISDPISRLNEYSDEVTLLDTMCAIIAKYLNVNFLEIKAMPINKVFKMFAICKAAFPNDIHDIEKKEEEGYSKVGENL